MKIALIGILCVCLMNQAAYAEDARFTIVPIGSQQPDRVVVSMDNASLPLSLSQQQWRGTLSYSVPATEPSVRGELVFEYSSLPQEAYLPLRLGRNVSLPEIRLSSPPKTDCSKTAIDFIELAGGSTRDKIDKYLQARMLALHNGQGSCGSNYRRRAELAWFYRSYDLSISAPYIHLDKDAVTAAKKHLPVKEVERVVAEVGAKELEVLNTEKIRLANSNRLPEAIAINDQLLTILKSNAELADAFEKKQRLTITVLEADGKWYGNRVNK